MSYHHHRPLTNIYGDNYRFGTSLYSPNAMDVEKNYRNSLAKTHLRSDRGDLGLYSFAGSHLHGGTPAADKGSGLGAKGSLRGPNSDLYSPINTTSYGPGYYDHLRATDREPRYRPARPDYLSDEPLSSTKASDIWVPSSYQTGPSKLTFEDDLNNRSTTKTTRTTEYWVPLTTHIYNTPYHTYYYKSTPFSSYTYRTADDGLYNYNYVDDYKRSTTTTTRSKNIDALDLSVTSRNYEKMDYSNHMSKCKDIQIQLDEVNKWVQEAEYKLKSDVIGSRSQMAADLADVAMIVEDTAKYSEDLHRVIRKQSKQINALNKQYESVNTTLADISDSLEKSRIRCQTLQSDLSSVQSGLELAMKRKGIERQVTTRFEYEL